MAFEPIQVSRNGGINLSIDRLSRIRISSAALKELAITTFTPVIISVDVENKRVGLVKQELAKVPNSTTVRPDKRGYLGTRAGKVVIDKLGLSLNDLPTRFEYVGRVDEGAVFWHAFELVKEAE